MDTPPTEFEKTYPKLTLAISTGIILVIIGNIVYSIYSLLMAFNEGNFSFAWWQILSFSFTIMCMGAIIYGYFSGDIYSH